jgi:hypothetical protein
MTGYRVSFGGYVSFFGGKGMQALTVLGLLEEENINDWSNSEDEDCCFPQKPDKHLPDWW